MKETEDALVEKLFSPRSEERIRSAIKLMSYESSYVDAAMIRGLDDSEERVVVFLCMALSLRNAGGANPKLLNLLGHISPRVRLTACKALIVLDSVTPNVVTVLQELVDTRQFAEDDKLAENFKGFSKEFETYGVATWGTTSEILQEARSKLPTN